MRILVTGGTGTLGRHVVREALGHGYTVRAQSRQPRPDDRVDLEWVRADLASGAGVAAALTGVDAVVHAASHPRRAQAVDVEGTRRLTEAARAAGVQHLLYVSIVGVERIPFRYYRAKAAAERIVAAGGIPWSTLRATQFHTLVDRLIATASRVPLVLPLPIDFRVQPVAAAEVAARLLRAVAEGASGRLPDFGGPEVLTLGDAAESWKRARGVARPLVRLPLPGRLPAAFRAGWNTVSEEERGRVTWEEWLDGPRKEPGGTVLP